MAAREFCRPPGARASACRCSRRHRCSNAVPVMPSNSWVLPVVGRPPGELLLDFLFRRAVENRRGEVNVQGLRSPAEVRLQNLTDVHTRRHAQRIQNDIHRSAIRGTACLLRDEFGDDTFVTVASGHFVTDRKLAFHGDVNFDQLDDALRRSRPSELGDLLVGDLLERRDLLQSSRRYRRSDR